MFKRKNLKLSSILVLLSMLLLISIFSVDSLGDESVSWNDHTITFTGVVYNNGGTSTWNYTVESGTSPAISHWILLTDCFANVNSVTGEGYVKSGSQEPEGIKFDDGYNDDQTKHISIVLDGWYPKKDTDVVIKAGSVNSGGGEAQVGPIPGPDCDLCGSPSINVEKDTNSEDADSEPGPYIKVGDPVTWTYEVTNTSNYNIPLTDVTIEESDPAVTPTYQSGDNNDNDALETDEIWIYEATGTAIEGQYGNTGTIEGTRSWCGTGTTVSDTDPSHYFGYTASISLVKTGTFNDEDGDGIADVGETIGYDFTVTNDGNVKLSSVSVADPDVDVTGGPISLAPGASDSNTFNGSYTITQDDINAGQFDNTATATGTSPSGSEVTGDGSDSVSLNQNPAISLTKTGTFNDEDGDGIADVGETIGYDFTVTNDGNVKLSSVSVADPDVDVTGGPISLAPGASDSNTFNGSYTITQDDINAGQFDNTATATGTSPSGSEVTDQDSDTQDFLVEPVAQLTMSADSTNEVGDTHTFTATLEIDSDGDGDYETTQEGEDIDFTLSGEGDLSNESLTNADGEATVDLDSADPGTSTVTANWSGEVANVTVDAIPDSAEKSWVDARLELTPETDTNAVGDDHEFTAYLEVNDGTGWEDGAGETINFSIVSDTASSSLSDTSATTDSNGEAQVTLTSDTPGTTTVEATFDGTVAGESISRTSNEAEKDWIESAARLTMSADSTNEVGNTHTFTATLELDEDGDGTYETTPSGEDITFSISSGVGSLSNETTTNSSGEATVEVDSAEAGTSTVTAKWSGEVANVTVDAIPDSGEKTWVLTNDPPTAENLFFTICENTSIEIALLATDPNIDPDNPQEHPMDFSIWASPTQGATSGDLSAITYVEEHEANVDATYTPSEDYVGEDFFTYQVEDPFGEVDQARVTVTVEECGPEEVAGGAAGIEEEVSINEIAWAGTGASAEDQWIELVNTTASEIDLTGWTLRWRKDETEEWKKVRLRGTIKAHDYYLLERLSDQTISDIKADLIYDVEEPHTLPLLNEGEVMQLVDKEGLVVDTANAEEPELGWPGGSANPVSSMERIDPEEEDRRENWGTNERIITKGKNRANIDLTATASIINERTLLARTYTGTPRQIESGTSLSFTVRNPEDSEADPKVLLTSSGRTMAGGAGSLMTGEVGGLTAENVPGLPNYQVTVDASKVEPGTYKLFIVSGTSVILEQPIEVTE